MGNRGSHGPEFLRFLESHHAGKADMKTQFEALGSLAGTKTLTGNWQAGSRPGGMVMWQLAEWGKTVSQRATIGGPKTLSDHSAKGVKTWQSALAECPDWTRRENRLGQDRLAALLNNTSLGSPLSS